MNAVPFERAIDRLPRWMLGLSVLGTAAAGVFMGLTAAGGFLLGSLAAFANFRLIERAVNRVTRLAQGEAARPGRKTGVGIFIQFTLLLLAAAVILRISGFSLAAAFCGFLVCPAAALLELIYELIIYDHS